MIKDYHVVRHRLYTGNKLKLVTCSIFKNNKIFLKPRGKGRLSLLQAHRICRLLNGEE